MQSALQRFHTCVLPAKKGGTMYKKILVAYDRTPASRAALTAAMELLDNNMAEHVTILSVMDNHDEDPTFEVAARMAGLLNEPIETDLEAPAIELEHSLVDLIKGHADACTTVVMRGKPADVVATAAKDLGIDLIIMGRRSKGALQTALGSVSTAVVRMTDLPVLLTK